jgi:lysophospholipase L1-like esterase
MRGTPFRRTGARAGLCLSALVLFERCSGSPPTAPPPPIGVICPANVSTQASQGQTTVTVIYPAPVVSGGKAPVNTSCNPASGTSFGTGTTPVSCTVSDAGQQSVACTFSVSVAAPSAPRLSATNFMAFGDSLTEGKTTQVPNVTFDTSYILKLAAMLQSRYTTQTIVVTGEGQGGESASDAIQRFDERLADDRPQSVLIMDGANDLLNRQASGIPGVITALNTMGLHAAAKGAVVFLATLPPSDPNKSRGAGGPFVASLNAQIASLAAAREWTLVDVNAAFKGDLTLLGPDGLHATDAGYQVIAQAFYDRIVERLEVLSNASPLGMR